MALTAVEGLVGNVALNDTFVLDDQQVVVISCANRVTGTNSIKGRLMQPLVVGASAQWVGMDSIAGGVSSIIGAVSAITVTTLGFSIYQPWFSRKFWKSTDPISVSAKLGFFASSSARAEEEVYKPCNLLLGLLYPRKVSGNSGNGLLEAYAPPGPNLYTGYDASGQIQSGAFSGSLHDTSSNTDYVSFTLGKLVLLDICYLDSVNISFSSSLNSEGYPLSATADVKVTALDVGVWTSDGYFLKQRSGAALNVASLVDAVCDTAGNLISQGKEAISNMTKSNADEESAS